MTLVSHHPSFFLALLHFRLTNLADTAAFHQGKCQKLLTLVEAETPVGNAAQTQDMYGESQELSAQKYFTGTTVN